MDQTLKDRKKKMKVIPRICNFCFQIITKCSPRVDSEVYKNVADSAKAHYFSYFWPKNYKFTGIKRGEITWSSEIESTYLRSYLNQLIPCLILFESWFEVTQIAQGEGCAGWV